MSEQISLKEIDGMLDNQQVDNQADSNVTEETPKETVTFSLADIDAMLDEGEKKPDFAAAKKASDALNGTGSVAQQPTAKTEQKVEQKEEQQAQAQAQAQDKSGVIQAGESTTLYDPKTGMPVMAAQGKEGKHNPVIIVEQPNTYIESEIEGEDGKMVEINPRTGDMDENGNTIGGYTRTRYILPATEEVKSQSREGGLLIGTLPGTELKAIKVGWKFPGSNASKLANTQLYDNVGEFTDIFKQEAERLNGMDADQVVKEHNALAESLRAGSTYPSPGEYERLAAMGMYVHARDLGYNNLKEYLANPQDREYREAVYGSGEMRKIYENVEQNGGKGFDESLFTNQARLNVQNSGMMADYDIAKAIGNLYTDDDKKMAYATALYKYRHNVVDNIDEEYRRLLGEPIKATFEEIEKEINDTVGESTLLYSALKVADENQLSNIAHWVISKVIGADSDGVGYRDIMRTSLEKESYNYRGWYNSALGGITFVENALPAYGAGKAASLVMKLFGGGTASRIFASTLMGRMAQGAASGVINLPAYTYFNGVLEGFHDSHSSLGDVLGGFTDWNNIKAALGEAPTGAVLGPMALFFGRLGRAVSGGRKAVEKGASWLGEGLAFSGSSSIKKWMEINERQKKGEDVSFTIDDVIDCTLESIGMMASMKLGNYAVGKVSGRENMLKNAKGERLETEDRTKSALQFESMGMNEIGEFLKNPRKYAKEHGITNETDMDQTALGKQYKEFLTQYQKGGVTGVDANAVGTAMWLIQGKAMMKPISYGSEIAEATGKDNKKEYVVYSLDELGNRIESKTFKNKEKAEKWQEELRYDAEKYDMAKLEAIAEQRESEKITQKTFDTMFDEIANSIPSRLPNGEPDPKYVVPTRMDIANIIQNTMVAEMMLQNVKGIPIEEATKLREMVRHGRPFVDRYKQLMAENRAEAEAKRIPENETMFREQAQKILDKKPNKRSKEENEFLQGYSDMLRASGEVKPYVGVATLNGQQVYVKNQPVSGGDVYYEAEDGSVQVQPAIMFTDFRPMDAHLDPRREFLEQQSNLNREELKAIGQQLEAEETAKRQNRQQEIEKKKKNAPVIDVQQPEQTEPKVDGSETPATSTETLQTTQAETPEPAKEEKSEASPEGKIEEPKTEAEHKKVIDEEQQWLDEHQEADPAEREQHRQRKWASERALGLRDENNNVVTPPPVPEQPTESETKSPTAQTERKTEELAPATEETPDMEITNEDLMKITDADLKAVMPNISEEELADKRDSTRKFAQKQAEKQRDDAIAYSRGEIKDKPENFDYWKERLGLEEPKAENAMQPVEKSETMSPSTETVQGNGIDLAAIKKRAEKFPDETPEEWAEFNASVRDMSDEELLAYMQEDGKNGYHNAHHPELWDEYDSRHTEEYLEEYDKAMRSILDSGISTEEAQKRLDSIKEDDPRYRTKERTKLSAEEEALTDFVQSPSSVEEWKSENNYVEPTGNKPPKKPTQREEPKTAEQKETREKQERAGLSAKEREIVNRVNAGIDETISDLDAEIRDLEKKGDEEGAEAARLEKEMLENSREDMIDDALDGYEDLQGFKNGTRAEKQAAERVEKSIADRKAKRMRELLEKLRDPNTSDVKRRAVVRQLADLGVDASGMLPKENEAPTEKIPKEDKIGKTQSKAKKGSSKDDAKTPKQPKVTSSKATRAEEHPWYKKFSKIKNTLASKKGEHEKKMQENGIDLKKSLYSQLMDQAKEKFAYDGTGPIPKEVLDWVHSKEEELRTDYSDALFEGNEHLKNVPVEFIALLGKQDRDNLKAFMTRELGRWVMELDKYQKDRIKKESTANLQTYVGPEAFDAQEELEKREKEEFRLRKKVSDAASKERVDEKTVKMYDFVGKDDLRPSMTGVYHAENGDEVACDTHILVVKHGEKDPELAGKIIDKKGNEINAHYPNYKLVFPYNENNEVGYNAEIGKTIEVDYGKLNAIMDAVTARIALENKLGKYGDESREKTREKYENYNNEYIIAIRVGNTSHGYQLKEIAKFFKGSSGLKLDKLSFPKDGNRALVATGENGDILLMPLNYTGAQCRFEIRIAKDGVKLIDKEKVLKLSPGVKESKGRVELNAATLKDPVSREYLEQKMEDEGWSEEARKQFMQTLDDAAEVVLEMGKRYKRLGDWNKMEILSETDEVDYNPRWRLMNRKGQWIPNRSAFKKNGEYPWNIDLGTLCTKRESFDALVQLITEKGMAQNLGPTQIEAIKELLKENDFLTACDICFNETKRARVISYANQISNNWRVVSEAIGVKDKMVGDPIALTQEQRNTLHRMAGRGYKSAFQELIPESERRQYKGEEKSGNEIDLGITASMMKKIAKQMLIDPTLVGKLKPETLITTEGMDWFLRTYGGHTDVNGILASAWGSGTPKPIEGFNLYDPLSWRDDYDQKKENPRWHEGLKSRPSIDWLMNNGGFRAQSFTDYHPMLFLDYLQMFTDVGVRKLPIHIYTKVPALVKLFGGSGAKINMSLVPKMEDGVDAEHAGLKPDGKGGWEYAWDNDSFPIEEAFSLRQDPRFRGNVGIIAVGLSDAHILKMLDDPTIDQVIPYHKSGMPESVQIKTGLKNATDYTDQQTTGGKPKKAADFNFNEAVRRTGDPRKAASEYVKWCEMNGYTPKFEQFKDHPNYYKVLADFRLFDNEGKYSEQEAVNPGKILGDNWKQELEDSLNDKTMQEAVKTRVAGNEKLMKDVERLMSKQRMDGAVRDEMVKKLKGALGKDNVESLKQNEFFNALEDAYKQTIGAEQAKAKVEVLRTTNGVVYGFASGGKITLNENVFNAETPIHEFTHIWVKVAQRENAKLWKKGKDLLKQTGEWQEVMNDDLYADIRGDEDAVASEVLARIVGSEGADYVRRLLGPEHKPLKQGGVYNQIKEWLREMFNNVRSLFAPSIRDLTYDEFVNMPLKTLFDEAEAKRFLEAKTRLESEGRLDGDVEGEGVELSVVKDPKEIERGTRYEEMARGYETSSRNTERRDREYAEAVEKGDTKKTEQMVKAAAKAAMPDTKVVDKDGAPLVVYHSTKMGDFYIFKHGEADTTNSLSSIGFWFSPVKEFGNGFAEGDWRGTYEGRRTMSVYLDMKNPKVYESTPKEEVEKAKKRIDELKDKAKEIYQKHFNQFQGREKLAFDEMVRMENNILRSGWHKNESNEDFWFNKLDDEQKDRVSKAIDEFRNSYDEYRKAEENYESEYRYSDAYEKFRTDIYKLAGKTPEDANIHGIGMSLDNVEGFKKQFVDQLREQGYDGIIIKGTRYDSKSAGGINDQYVVFDSNQIKSADPVTYDDAGNVIPLSERFNAEKQDIRYRLEEDKKPTFYSNAERAVEGIKQNKATAEQWKAMLTKAGGIKAGEDKWMGLSAWLDENKGKSLTKDEVLQFVRDNGIQMEEVEYRTGSYDDFEKQIIDKKGVAFRDKFFDAFTFDEQGGNGHEQLNAEIANEELAIELYQEDTGKTVELDEDGYIKNYDDEMNIRDWAASLYDLERPINPTRLEYTTYGLDNKREIAFKVPSIEPYKEHDEIHFGPENEGKAVMWVRFGETTDADGKRVLVIDEIQSNRHQKGREKGYVNRKEAINQIEELKAKFDDVLKEREDKLDQIAKRTGITDEGDLDYYIIKNQHEKDVEELFNLDEIAGTYQDKIESLESVAEGDYSGGEVPDAPFEKNWYEVAMKRMLRLAAEEGFDKVAWTTGKQQAERYDIGGVVDEVSVAEWNEPLANGKPKKEATVRIHYKNGDSTKLIVDKTTGIVTAFNDMSNAIGKPLSDVLGKELAQKILDNKHNYETWSGDNLRIGGKGMKGFYDQMLPRFMDKYGKKWGVKTGVVELPNVEEAGRTMHAVDVTPEMKESVMQGQPLFRKGFSRPRGEGHMEKVTEGVERANRQLGGNAKVVREAELGKDVPKNAQAWYDPNTGEVHVVAERVNGAEDASRAVWHEEIGHKAMSELLGDRYNEWLDDVHKLLGSEHADAMKRLREKYAKELEGKSEEAQNRLLADEWIAELAERGEKDLSTWQKVKGMFRNWLWKHFGVMLGDGDIDYMLHKALAERRKGYRSKAMMSIAEHRRAEEGNAMAEQSRRYRLLDEENRAEAKSRARDLLEAERDELNDRKTQMEDALNRALTVRRGDPSAENLAMSPRQRRELATSIERLEKRIDALNDSLAETDLTDPERVVDRAWDHVGLATEAEMLMQKAESLMKTKDILRNAGVTSVENLTPEQRKEYDRYLWNGKIADARLTAMRDARPERPFEGSIDDNLGREPQYDDFRHPDLDRDDLSERDRDYLERQANDNYSRAKAEWNRKKERLIEQLDDYEAECDDWRMRQRDYMREIVDAEKKLRADWQTDYWSAMENNQEADALLHVADMTGIPLTSKHDVQTYLRELRYEHVRRQQHAEGEDYKFIKEIESMVDKAVGTGSLANKVRKHGDRKQVMRDLIDMMEGTKEVTEEMKPIVKKIQQWFDDMFEWQVASGLVYAPWKYRQGYVPHLWNIDASRPDADAAAKIEKAGGLVPTRMSSPFMNERFYDTYEEGIQHGLVPKHESIIDLIKEYSKEVNKAVSNRQALDILRFVKAPIETEVWVEQEGGGKEKVKQTQWLPIVIDAGEVPPKGVQYNAYKNSAFYKDGTPQFLILSPRYVKGTERNIYSMFGEQGYVSTKDAADSNLEKALGTADKASQMVKQTNLMFSAFHGIALTEHMLGSSRNPLRVIKQALYDTIIESVVTGKTLRMRKADVAEDAMSHFVKMGNSYDFGRSMDVLTKLSDMINNPDNPEWRKFVNAKNDKERAKAAKALIRGTFGTPFKLLKLLKKGNDFILWDMLHDGYKLSVWDLRSRKLREKAEKKGWSEAELNRRLDDLGQTINDMFGGQHWELLNASPRAMRNLRLAFLSPDWNASWMRLWGRMAGMGKLRNDNFFRGLKNEEGNWQSPISGKAIKKAWKENNAQGLAFTVMLVSGLMCHIGYSLMNLAMRKKDIEEELAKAEAMRDEDGKIAKLKSEHPVIGKFLPETDPNYKSPYEEEGITPITWENFLSRANEWILSPWNSLSDPGRGTYVYVGRDANGVSRYIRPGKQMRELFELFLDSEDHLDLGAWYKAGMRKANPFAQLIHEAGTGYSLTGWENKDLTQTYGAERELNRLKYVILHAISPISAVDPIEKSDTEKMGWRFAYPVSKGLTWYRGNKLLEEAIANDDSEMVEHIKRSFVLNGMGEDFEKAYSSSLSKVRRNAAKAEDYENKTPDELFKMAAKSNDPKMRKKYVDKATEKLESTEEKEGKTAREAMEEYQQKAQKEGNYLLHCKEQDMEYDAHMKIFMKKAEEDGSVVATFRKMGGKIPKVRTYKNGEFSRIKWAGQDGYTNADCEKFYKEHEDELIAYYRMNMFREGYNARIKEMKDLKGKEADAKMKEIRKYRDEWMKYASEYLDTTTWKVKKHTKK